jgi:hypothetical protein
VFPINECSLSAFNHIVYLASTRSHNGVQGFQPRTWPTPYFHSDCMTLIDLVERLTFCFSLSASTVALFPSYP